MSKGNDCPRCRGAGVDMDGNECQRCDGWGTLDEHDADYRYADSFPESWGEHK